MGETSEVVQDNIDDLWHIPINLRIYQWKLIAKAPDTKETDEKSKKRWKNTAYCILEMLILNNRLKFAMNTAYLRGTKRLCVAHPTSGFFELYAFAFVVVRSFCIARRHYGWKPLETLIR